MAAQCCCCQALHPLHCLRTPHLPAPGSSPLLPRPPAGASPLIAAVVSGSLSIVKALLAAGADPKHTDRQGTTAVELVRGPDAAAIRDLLLKYARRIDCKKVRHVRLPVELCVLGGPALRYAPNRPCQVAYTCMLRCDCRPVRSEGHLGGVTR